LIFFKTKKEPIDNNTEVPNINKKIHGITRTIEEFSDEQREIIEKFKIDMEKFTIERTLESCLQALNLSMQLANTRERLIEAYKEYSILLENELKKLLEEKKRNNIF
jgi:predicted nucleotide-binding protein (sugar kinase/HSP70/actin superfamily)